MLTAKGKYGLKALIHLASLRIGETAQSADIAQSNRISKKFLDTILGDLRSAGLVHSKKGPGGGYMLACHPEAINIGHAIRKLDGPRFGSGKAVHWHGTEAGLDRYRPGRYSILLP